MLRAHLNTIRAFDKVWHLGFMYKIDLIGIRQKISSLMNNFSINRVGSELLEGSTFPQRYSKVRYCFQPYIIFTRQIFQKQHITPELLTHSRNLKLSTKYKESRKWTDFQRNVEQLTSVIKIHYRISKHKLVTMKSTNANYLGVSYNRRLKWTSNFRQ